MSEEKAIPQKRTSKVEKLLHELEEEKKRSEQYLTQLKYMQADFENFRKRTDRQLEDMRRYSNEQIILQILEIADELELAIKSGQNSNTPEALSQGVEMIYKKLMKILEHEGVTRIECVGKTFDPSKHSIIASIEKEEVEEGTILEEIRKGYILKEKVIRPSIVKVAVKPKIKSD